MSHCLYFGQVQVYLEEAVRSFPCIGWHFWSSYFVSSGAHVSKPEVSWVWIHGNLCPQACEGKEEDLGAGLVLFCVLNCYSCSGWWDSCCLRRLFFVRLGHFVCCPVSLGVGELFCRWLWVFIYMQRWMKPGWLHGRPPVLASPASFQMKSGDWISRIETLEPAYTFCLLN